jgi:hypothetical protein
MDELQQFLDSLGLSDRQRQLVAGLKDPALIIQAVMLLELQQLRLSVAEIESVARLSAAP